MQNGIFMVWHRPAGSQQVNELEQVMAQRISMVGSSYQLVQQLCEAVSEANSPAGSSCTIAARIMGQAAGHGGRAAGRGHSGSRQDVSGATLQIWLPTLSQKASFPKHLLVNYGRGSEASAADASAAEPPFHARSRFLRCVDGDPASQGKREGDDTQGTLAEFQCAMTHIPEGPHIAQQIQAAGVVWTSPSSRHSTQEAQGAPCNLLAPSGSAGDGAKSGNVSSYPRAPWDSLCGGITSPRVLAPWASMALIDPPHDCVV